MDGYYNQPNMYNQPDVDSIRMIKRPEKPLDKWGKPITEYTSPTGVVLLVLFFGFLGALAADVRSALFLGVGFVFCVLVFVIGITYPIVSYFAVLIYAIYRIVCLCVAVYMMSYNNEEWVVYQYKLEQYENITKNMNNHY